MKKFTLIAGILVGAIILGFSVYFANQRKQSKQYSPEAKARYEKEDLRITVFYNRPYKKGREIFGKLVPYGKMWRTGANEATVVANTKDILIDGKVLKSGRHHLITIPYADHWTIILNADVPGWGINQETGKVYHNAKEDELVFDLPVIKQSSVTEQFTIAFDQKQNDLLGLSLAWDSVLVNIPVSRID